MTEKSNTTAAQNALSGRRKNIHAFILKKNKKFLMLRLPTRITPLFCIALTLFSSSIFDSAWADNTPSPAKKIICPDKKAAASGSSADEYALGLAYEKGNCGITADQKSAVQWYTRAAEQGHMLAQYHLAEIYFTGSSNGGTPDYPAAKRWYRAAAGQGHGLSQLRLAYLCAERHFKGVTTDYNEAEKWFIAAAKQNAGDAQFRLGNFYHNYKRPPDMQKAVYWLTKASEGGSSIAMFDLAMILKKGEGVPKDPAQSLMWLKKSADGGMIEAPKILSEIYASGDGVPKDPQQSFIWTLRAAQEPTATPYWIDKAADMVFSGDGGVPQNYPEALKLYNRAAIKEDPHAEARLGRMYLQGLGVTADPVKGRAYLNKAAAAGDSEAKALLSGKN